MVIAFYMLNHDIQKGIKDKWLFLVTHHHFPPRLDVQRSAQTFSMWWKERISTLKKEKKWLEEIINKNNCMNSIIINKAIYNVPSWDEDCWLSPIEIPSFSFTSDKCVGLCYPPSLQVNHTRQPIAVFSCNKMKMSIRWNNATFLLL